MESEQIFTLANFYLYVRVWGDLEAVPLVQLRNTSLEWSIAKYHNTMCSPYNTVSMENGRAGEFGKNYALFERWRKANKK